MQQMSQHFLLSPRAKTLALASVMRMSNEEAETMFARIRWPDTDGAPVCPHCAGQALYNVRRPGGPPRWRWRCKRMQQGIHRDQRDPVRVAQAAGASLPRR